MKKKTWSRYLNEVFGCPADMYGNRPCDWGMYCNECQKESVTKDFEKWLKEEEKEK